MRDKGGRGAQISLDLEVLTAHQLDMGRELLHSQLLAR